MFGKAKKLENKFVIAVKDFAETKKNLEAETLSVPFEKSLYRELISTAANKVDNLRGLSKFIKLQNKNKGDVRHYWEGLISEGYTLMDVQYDKKVPAIERLCDTVKFKFVCRA
ncbi:MAG: hypothetical protein FIA99_13855 [Ruminiclostridium sp.]|nr:hypothetical protein [Ruminiclostridium sp.]